MADTPRFVTDDEGTIAFNRADVACAWVTNDDKGAVLLHVQSSKDSTKAKHVTVSKKAVEQIIARLGRSEND